MLDGEVVSNPSDDEDEAPRLRHGTLTSEQLNKRIEQLKEAEAREAAEPQAEECTCAWAHVGVHTSMCESEVEGKGKDMQLWLSPKAQLELLVRDLSRKINGSCGSSTKA